jgi:hypothetical protein
MSSAVFYFSTIMNMNKKKIFISFYQYDCDNPNIIAFDTFKAAQREARKDIRKSLPNRKDWKEYLDQFEINGHVSINRIVIFAGTIEYRQKLPTPENWILMIEKHVDALSDAEASADTELFESFEAAEKALKLHVEHEISNACLTPENIVDLQAAMPIHMTGEGKARELLWKSTYLNMRCSVYHPE